MQTGTNVWDKEKLCSLVKEKLGNRRLVVVSNREPYEHIIDGGKVVCRRPVGGLTEALDPVMRAAGGCWVAYGSGDADHKVVDSGDCVEVPPEAPEYTLRRVWLTGGEIEGYYLGFANESLWPLCHISFTPPVFNDANWEIYRSVNRKFADAVLQETGGQDALVLVQDYHLALVSGMIKEARPDLVIGQFWHIPWPPYDVFRACPWREDILEGLLGNDLLGFHIPRFGENYLSCVRNSCGLKAEHLEQQTVSAFPISIDFRHISESAASADVEIEMVRLEQELGLKGKYVGIGMDRVDYTKGIPERLMAFERFLENSPEYRGRVVFIQAGMPSRSQIGAYQKLGNRIETLISSINGTYGSPDWQPVITLAGRLSYETLNALRRLAHFCVVSSLDDGMNLVAKEYPAARNDGDGVLILSEFTGAALELADALMVNPYDIAGFAARIREAIEMPEKERRRRMAGLRLVTGQNNIYRWAGDLLSRLIEVGGKR